MRTRVIFLSMILCLFSSVVQSRTSQIRVDQLQEGLFGVSTLKGVREVRPYVELVLLKENATEISTTSKIETLVRSELEEEVIQALKKADIKISEKSDMTSPDAPLSLKTTVFVKLTGDSESGYIAFIYTEATQPITLSRDNAIRSFSRTWPMSPAGLYTRNIFMLNSQTLEKTVKDEVIRQAGYFITDYLAANPKPVVRSAAGVDIEALRKTLFTEAPNLKGTFRVRDNDPHLQAVQQLESAGSQEAINVLLECLTNGKMDCKLKQSALSSLGKIGTKPAIDAIKEFEDWGQKKYVNPQPFQMGIQEFAIDHFASSDTQPFAQTTDTNNKTWALVALSRYGEYEPYLTSMNENKQWSEPVFINFPDFLKLRNTKDIKWNLKVDGDSVTIASDKIYEYKISGLVKDSDKDGLPDLVEERFLTDPQNTDSDNDGVPDGKDSNPLTPRHKDANDAIEIRQAVFSALFATNNSRNAIVIVDRGEFARQEYYGFGGAVLKATKNRNGFVNVTSIDIKYQSKDAATVWISDWEGSLAASVHEAKLNKVDGKWIVVEIKLTLIS